MRSKSHPQVDLCKVSSNAGAQALLPATSRSLKSFTVALDQLLRVAKSITLVLTLLLTAHCSFLLSAIRRPCSPFLLTLGFALILFAALWLLKDLPPFSGRHFATAAHFSLLVLLLLEGTASAQTSFLDEPGIPAFTTAFPVENGFINLANGNLHIEIPIATYPQRGAIKALHGRLVYDSRFWMVQHDLINDNRQWAPNGITQAGVNLDGGFRFVTDGEAGSVTFSESSQQCGCSKTDDTGGCIQPEYRTTFTDYVYQEPDGTNHRAPTTPQFKLFQSSGFCVGGNQVPTGSTLAGDNSGYKFVITKGSIAMYRPDGTLEPHSGVAGAPAVQDANGNFHTFSKTSDPTVVNIVDTLGRTPVVVSRSGSQVFLDYLCEQGCNPAGGDRVRVTVNTEPKQWVTQFNQTGVGEYSGGTRADVQSIVFPDGSSYSFTYDSYGMMTGITLPTGGHITYGYANFTTDGQGSVNRWVTSRVADGQTWNFTPTLLGCGSSSSGCQLQVTVTTPPYNDGTITASDDHVYTFTGSTHGNWNTETQYFRGAADGAPILTKTTDYGAAGTCPALAGFFEGSVPIRETLIWPASSGGTLSKKAEYCYDNYGNRAATKEWDYQPNGNFAATPDREIDDVYVTDPGYIGANMLRLLHSSTTYANGVQVAQTTYNYDDYTSAALQPSGVATGHVTPPGPRGNLTSVVRWLNTRTSPVTSTTAWYDTGEVYQATDPMIHSTTFTYDAAFFGAYPTKICNAKNQCSYTAYDFNTGLVTSTTDVNGTQAGDPGHTTQYSFDNMLRPLCTDLPDGGQTCRSYPTPNEVQTQTKITSDLPLDTSFSILDGLGRVSHIQQTLPEGTATVDTTYDPLGRVASVSNPYLTTTDATYGLTQTLYDALGRPVRITKQDGGTVLNSYSAAASSVNGLCTTTTDEAGKLRRSCHDGFGQLREVDEPGDSFAGSTAQGSFTISGDLQTFSSPAVQATGSIALSGADRSIVAPDTPLPCPSSGCPRIYDSGSVGLGINGAFYSVGYAQGENASAGAIAFALVNAINAGSGDPNVIATQNGTIVKLQARAPGTAGNSIPVSFSSSSDDPTDFPSGSFAGTVTAMSGGAPPGSPVSDAGSISITVGQYSASTSYGNGSGLDANAAAIAADLVTKIQAQLPATNPPYSINVPPDSSQISVSWNSVGTSGDITVSASSSTTQTAYFSVPSFTACGQASQNPQPCSIPLSGGFNPEGPSLDFNYFVTKYSYNGLGDLTAVTQEGDPSSTPSNQWRIRNFSYDSLSRLLTATNPESGTITYTYDDDGDVLTKTAPAPNQPVDSTATVTTTYTYDELNRVTYIRFSDGTYRGGFTYDETVSNSTSIPVTNGIGRLTSSWEAWGGQGFSYDVMGRPIRVRRAVGHSLDFFYTYNLDGSVKSLQYPSGRVLNYGYDSAGRAISAVDSNGTQYVLSATYTPTGALSGYVSGANAGFGGINHSFLYNSRLQLCRITAWTTGSVPPSCDDSTNHGNLIDRSYNFAFGTANNGNVLGITDYRDSSRSQSFTYDALNRLTSAQNAGTDCSKILPDGHTEYWGNSYGYDAWGNLTNKSITKCAAENFSVAALPNNQLTGYGYDTAGNMTNDLTSGLSYTYDAGNMLKTIGPISYLYDADGNRFAKWNNGTPVKSYFYGANDEILAEGAGSSNLTAEYIFFNGKRIARADQPGNAVHYYLSDALNTTSMEVNPSGVVENESDYYPWGGELKFTANDSGNHYKFTGKERDTESNLDYFGARYYSNGLGRFSSADWSSAPVPVPYADFTDPQSLNQYSYVRNIPTSKVDPDGHCPLCTLEEEVVDLVVEHPKAAAAIATVAEKTEEAVIETAGVGEKTAVNTAGVLVFVLTASQTTAPPKSDEPHPDSETQTQQAPEPATDGAGSRQGNGRGGRQQRLSDLSTDDKLNSAHSGWLKNEERHVQTGNRASRRVPPGTELAHRRGKEARKGYDYSHSDLQEKNLHKTQHQVEHKHKKKP